MARSVGSLAVFVGLSTHAFGQLPTFEHLKQIDLSSDFSLAGVVGDQVTDIAFDGTFLYLAGNRSVNGTGSVGIVRIANVLSIPSRTIFFSVSGQAGGNRDSRIVYRADANASERSLYFGTGLGARNEVQSGFRRILLTSAQDPAFGGDGVLTPNEIGGSTNQRTDALAIDPLGGLNRLAFVNMFRDSIFRRNPLTGAVIDQITFSPVPLSLEWNSITFDPSGNAYLRRENKVWYAPRLGVNQLGDIGSTPLVNLTGVDAQQQGIDWHPAGTGFAPFLTFNSRRVDHPWLLVTDTAGKPVDLATEIPTVRLTGGEVPVQGTSSPFDSSLISACEGTIDGKRYLFVAQGGVNDKLSVYAIVSPSSGAVTVSGELDLGFFEPSSIGSRPFVIEIRRGGSVLETKQVQLTSSFRYSFQTTVQGSCEVAIMGQPWLRRVVSGLSIGAAGLTVPRQQLINGDVDGDNAVTVFDYGILSDQFDTPGPDADLDGDGIVSVFDYGILSDSFDQVGDE